MKTYKELNVSVHWKQGDDLHSFLKETENPVQALRLWADSFQEHARDLRELAARLEGKDIDIIADTHHISIEGLSEADKEKLDKESPLCYLFEWDEEEDW